MKDRPNLEGKSIEDLKYIAKMLGHKNLSRIKKADLIELITSSGEVPVALTQKNDEPVNPKVETVEPVQSPKEKKTEATKENKDEKKRRGRPKVTSETKKSVAPLPTQESTASKDKGEAPNETEKKENPVELASPAKAADSVPLKGSRGRP